VTLAYFMKDERENIDKMRELRREIDKKSL